MSPAVSPSTTRLTRGTGLFAPTANVTREESAQMVYNYAHYREYSLTQEGNLSKFEDASSAIKRLGRDRHKLGQRPHQ